MQKKAKIFKNRSLKIGLLNPILEKSCSKYKQPEHARSSYWNRLSRGWFFRRAIVTYKQKMGFFRRLSHLENSTPSELVKKSSISEYWLKKIKNSSDKRYVVSMCFRNSWHSISLYHCFVKYLATSIGWLPIYHYASAQDF